MKRDKKNLFKAEILRIGRDRFGFNFDKESIREIAFQIKSKETFIYSGESSVGRVVDIEEYDDHVSVLFSSYFSPPSVPVYVGVMFKVEMINGSSYFDVDKLILLNDKVYPSQPSIFFMGFVEEIEKRKDHLNAATS